jgi:hypothetical protein
VWSFTSIHLNIPLYINEVDSSFLRTLCSEMDSVRALYEDVANVKYTGRTKHQSKERLFEIKVSACLMKRNKFVGNTTFL